jgi:hypothetical protein
MSTIPKSVELLQSPANCRDKNNNLMIKKTPVSLYIICVALKSAKNPAKPMGVNHALRTG